MIIADRFHPAETDGEDHLYSTFHQPAFVARIADDLRGLYGDVATGSQPDYLMELASRIDASLVSSEHEG